MGFFSETASCGGSCLVSLACVAGAGYGLLQGCFTYAEFKYERVYGDVESPVFCIASEGTPVDIRTFADDRDAFIEAAQSLDSNVERLHELFVDLVHRRRFFTGSFSADEVDAALDLCDSLGEYDDLIEPSQPFLWNYLSSEEDAEILQRSCDIFKSMTGKDFPVSLRLVNFASEDPGTAGEYHPLDQYICSDYGSDFYMLASLMHEFGHVCCQHGEQEMFSVSNEGFERTHPIEEACAYSFEAASLYFVEDKDLRDDMLSHIEALSREHCIDYFEGSHECHDVGGALADAAISFFGNAIDAYAYLSTTPYADISDDIWDVVEENKRAYLRFKESRDSLLELRDRFQSLSSD